ncbi:MAG: hypothetical protein ACTSQE_12685 [Candidatus Heimdallarchaeaceae archaeon]
MKKNRITSFFIITLFILTSISSANVKGETASDQLELNVGTYVKGRYYAEATNETIANVKISVVKIWNISGSLDAVAIEQRMDYLSGSENLYFGDQFSTVIFTSLIWMHNRTIIFPAARLYLENSTYSADISVLDGNSIDEIKDIDNTKITFKDGSTYIWGSLETTDDRYWEIWGLMFAWALINAFLMFGNTYTWLAINPNTEEGMVVNYRNSTAQVEDYTSFTVDSKKHSTIHVHQAKNKVQEGIFTVYFNEIDAYYEDKTGFIIKWKEKDYNTDEISIFEPTEVNIESNIFGMIDFSFTSVFLGFMVLALSVLKLRRKK